jgi:hypothetical protein
MQEVENMKTRDAYTAVIECDPEPESPEDLSDDVGTETLFLVTSHRDFTVGPQEFLKADPEDTRKEFHVFPVRAYIHSGVSLSLSGEGYPFNCQWDSAWIGCVFITRKEGVFGEGLDPKKIAQGLIDLWNQYLSGQVYGYKIYETCPICLGRKEVDSCWGFYGTLDSVQAEADAAIDSLVEYSTGVKQA